MSIGQRNGRIDLIRGVSISLVLLHHFNIAYLYAYFACFDGIAIGCCAALIAKRVAVHGRAAALAQIAVVVAMSWLYLFRSIGHTNVLGVTAMALGTAWLLICASGFQPTLSKGHYGIRPMLRWLGRRSYPLRHDHRHV